MTPAAVLFALALTLRAVWFVFVQCERWNNQRPAGPWHAHDGRPCRIPPAQCDRWASETPLEDAA